MWEWRLVVAVGRRMIRAVRTRFVGVMMHIGQPLVSMRLVMFLAFKVREVVLRFLRNGPNSSD